MIACVDVYYQDVGVQAAGVGFLNWTDSLPSAEAVITINDVEPYQSGEFYRRELPCILAILERLPQTIQTVIVDGYVWLGDENAPGLGAYLYEALTQKVAVIGVAKKRFYSAQLVQEVLRGSSQNPLYVSAIGIELVTAAQHIQSMHGEYRIPTLLKRVDQLSRSQTPG